MSKIIQLRHAPDSVHRRLKAHAAPAGLSLSDFPVREVRKIAEQPTLEEMLERLSVLPTAAAFRQPGYTARAGQALKRSLHPLSPATRS